MELISIIFLSFAVFSIKSEVFGTFSGSEILSENSSHVNHLEFSAEENEERFPGWENAKTKAMADVFRKKMQNLKAHRQVELVILVDGSFSVGPKNFFSEIKYIQKVISDVEVGADAFRLAIVIYSTKAVIYVDHLSVVDPTELEKCSLLHFDIPRILYPGTNTNTREALEKAEKILTRARRGAKKVVFLLTDGFSNMGNPLPMAQILKSQDIVVYTFGIKNGNARDLLRIASEPPEEHAFLFDSFDEFEGFARRSLHKDLNPGTYVPARNSSSCRHLCPLNPGANSKETNSGCCSDESTCGCGLISGHFACICPPGYYGSGLIGEGCKLCPEGTYSEGSVPGDSSICKPCPDAHHVTVSRPATSKAFCICDDESVADGDGCRIVSCPSLLPPANGYFVRKNCSSAVNAACGVRCHAGFDLIGSSVRICLRNGTWSGTSPVCRPKSCPPLKPVPSSNVRCSNEEESYEASSAYDSSGNEIEDQAKMAERRKRSGEESSNSVGTVCSYSCSTGHSMVGSKSRVCLPLLKWSGLKPTCKSIKCHSLPDMDFGRVEPRNCTDKGLKHLFGKVCRFHCNSGYELRGPKELNCTGKHGSWSGKSAPSKCFDVEPPMIDCPQNLTAKTDPFVHFATIELKMPETKDNSGKEPIIWSKPPFEDDYPLRFLIGLTEIQIYSVDDAGNYGFCSFIIEVKDEEKPRVLECQSPSTFFVSEFRDSGDIIWKEPVFDDNSGVPLTVTKTPATSTFSKGTTPITYTATDDSGNSASCTLNITILENPCSERPEESNTIWNCTTDSADLLTSCLVSCPKGYGFVTDTALESLQLNCTYNKRKAQWTPNLFQGDVDLFPDCSELSETENEIILDGPDDICNDQNSSVFSEIVVGEGNSVVYIICEDESDWDENEDDEDDQEEEESHEGMPIKFVYNGESEDENDCADCKTEQDLKKEEPNGFMEWDSDYSNLINDTDYDNTKEINNNERFDDYEDLIYNTEKQSESETTSESEEQIKVTDVINTSEGEGMKIKESSEVITETTATDWNIYSEMTNTEESEITTIKIKSDGKEERETINELEEVDEDKSEEITKYPETPEELSSTSETTKDGAAALENETEANEELVSTIHNESYKESDEKETKPFATMTDTELKSEPETTSWKIMTEMEATTTEETLKTPNSAEKEKTNESENERKGDVSEERKELEDKSEEITKYPETPEEISSTSETTKDGAAALKNEIITEPETTWTTSTGIEKTEEILETSSSVEEVKTNDLEKKEVENERKEDATEKQKEVKTDKVTRTTSLESEKDTESFVTSTEIKIEPEATWMVVREIETTTTTEEILGTSTTEEERPNELENEGKEYATEKEKEIFNNMDEVTQTSLKFEEETKMADDGNEKSAMSRKKRETEKKRKRIRIRLEPKGKKEYQSEGGNENLIRYSNETSKIIERFHAIRGKNEDGVPMRANVTKRCRNGSILRNNICLKCPKGTFHSRSRSTCVPCPLGHFQEAEGQSRCLRCPRGFWTKKIRRKTSKQCKRICPAGTFGSGNGNSSLALWPCSPCPLGTFQPLSGQTFCQNCPEGQTTLRLGANDSDSCILKRSKEEELCLKMNCRNGGTCFVDGGFAFCKCEPGFAGSFCERLFDPCGSSPCYNGGHCKTLSPLEYKCSCLPGFEGDNCQIESNECLSNPCNEHGDCIDLLNGFRCECFSGFEGPFCNETLDFCRELSPCLNSGTCVNTEGGYFCICRNGFFGQHCDVVYDCGPDDCTSDLHPCANVTCSANMVCEISRNGRGECKCVEGFRGSNCTEEVNPNVILRFPKYGVTEYLTADFPNGKLDEISICTWIKTKDTFNYGTIFSYATQAEDNAFTLTDYSGLVLYVSGRYVVVDLQANDGFWHFICVTWQSDGGLWKVYQDGVLFSEGERLSDNTAIEGNGKLVVGQEQDAFGGGFNDVESFAGSLTNFDVWNKALKASEIKAFYSDCDIYSGNLISWPRLLQNVHGAILEEEYTFCRTCNSSLSVFRGQIKYDFDGHTKSATYICDEGFIIKFDSLGSSVRGQSTKTRIYMRKCMKYGDWHMMEPRCSRISCGFPGYFLRGRIKGRAYKYGDVITYQCIEGYSLEGNETRVCLSNGSWSGEAPYCRSNSTECRKLLAPRHGSMFVYLNKDRPYSSSVLEIGDRIEFTCDKGYAINGFGVLTCIEGGLWDREVPTCKKTTCRYPKEFGRVMLRVSENSTFNVDDSLIVTCSSGLRHKITCGSLGTWNATAALCQNICRQKPRSVKNGYIIINEKRKGMFREGEMLQVSCLPGFKLIGDNFVVCSGNGTWSQAHRSFCRKTTCGRPPRPPPSYQIVYEEGHNTGDKIFLRCAPGYESFGDIVMECQPNGRYSRIRNHCTEISCPVPILPPNYSVATQKQNHSYGSKIIVQCPRGRNFVNNSINYIECQADKKWTAVPDCS